MASLTGQLLIAMPQMQDPFFARSVVGGVFIKLFLDEMGR